MQRLTRVINWSQVATAQIRKLMDNQDNHVGVRFFMVSGNEFTVWFSTFEEAEAVLIQMGRALTYDHPGSYRIYSEEDQFTNT